MFEYLIIRNPKADQQEDGTNVIFDYLPVEAFRNPTGKQRNMLLAICDGFEFVKCRGDWEAKDKLKKGDWLFSVTYKDKELIMIKK